MKSEKPTPLELAFLSFPGCQFFLRVNLRHDCANIHKKNLQESQLREVNQIRTLDQMYTDFRIPFDPCRPGVVTCPKKWDFKPETAQYVARGTLQACSQSSGESP